MENTALRISLLAVVVLMTAASAVAETKPFAAKWKEYPHVLLERSEIPAILEKAKAHDWARGELDRIRSSADEWMKKRIEYPPSTGRHPWSYVCPDCKESLETLSPTEHKCPKCGKVYSGLPYDAVLYRARHMQLARVATNCALAALLFEKPAYARKSLNILLGYANRYSSYPLLDVVGGQSDSGARIFDQTLNEAGWLVEIAWAYDLLRGTGVGTPEQHRKIEDDLLRASAETIKKARWGRSNWQSWHNAGLAAAAVALKDTELLELAINDRSHGFYRQMEASVLPDGTWYEGSWGYHFYALNALLKTAESVYRSGVDLYSSPPLKKMLEVPLSMVMPNGKLPATNDGEETALPMAQYELAAARYGDAVFQSVVASRERKGLEALIVGIDDPKESSEALSSVVLKESGLAVLRRGGQYISLDFGPHGGGHGHLDKLAVNYYTAGQVFAPDPGRGWPYNLPIHGQWYKTTLSHNTVTVDGKPQAEAEGSLESYDFSRDYHTVTAVSNECYEGVKMRRTLAMGDTWLLDIFEVSSDVEHTYDWVWHGRGDFSSTLITRPAEFDESHVSYSYLSNVRVADGAGDWTAEWSLPGGKVYALFRGSPDRQAYLCDAPDNPRTDTLHSVILRDRRASSTFVCLFSTVPMTWADLPAELGKSIAR